ncbi:MAG TPA: hypothetical protein V6D00_04515 [Pantanalinema sp.]
MAHPIGRIARASLLAAGVLIGTTSCTLGNPFMPKAKILVTAQPQVATSKLTYDEATKLFKNESDRVTFTLKSFPGDITPGVLFTDYKIRFLDQKGTEISDTLIPHRQLKATLYVPRGGGGTGTATTGGSEKLEVAAISGAVETYGIVNGFRSNGGAVTVNGDPWNQNLIGEITFTGRDDNQNIVEAVGTFTVNFVTDIQSEQAAK